MNTATATTVKQATGKITAGLACSPGSNTMMAY